MILLQDQSHLSFELAISLWGTPSIRIARWIGPVARRHGVQELRQLRFDLSTHRGNSKRTEWHQVRVPFTHPIDESVATRVTHEYVDARAAVDSVLEPLMQLRLVVQV